MKMTIWDQTRSNLYENIATNRLKVNFFKITTKMKTKEITNTSQESVTSQWQDSREDAIGRCKGIHDKLNIKHVNTIYNDCQHKFNQYFQLSKNMGSRRYALIKIANKIELIIIVTKLA